MLKVVMMENPMRQGALVDSVLSCSGAAKMLGISRRRLKSLLDDGRIAFQTVGRRRVIQSSDLVTYREQTVEAALTEMVRLQEDMGLYS
jgi:excisionase family DNA binding protein